MIGITKETSIDYYDKGLLNSDYDYLSEDIDSKEVKIFDRIYKYLIDSNMANLLKSWYDCEYWEYIKINNPQIEIILSESREISDKIGEWKNSYEVISEWIDKYNEYDIENNEWHKYSLYVDDGEIKLMERKYISKKLNLFKVI